MYAKMIPNANTCRMFSRSDITTRPEHIFAILLLIENFQFLSTK